MMAYSKIPKQYSADLYKRVKCGRVARQLTVVQPSCVPMLPRELYGDGNTTAETFSAEPPVLDPERAKGQAQNIARDMNDFIAMEGMELFATEHGLDLDIIVQAYEAAMRPGVKKAR